MLVINIEETTLTTHQPVQMTVLFFLFYCKEKQYIKNTWILCLKHLQTLVKQVCITQYNFVFIRNSFVQFIYYSHAYTQFSPFAHLSCSLCKFNHLKNKVYNVYTFIYLVQREKFICRHYTASTSITCIFWSIYVNMWTMHI